MQFSSLRVFMNIFRCLRISPPTAGDLAFTASHPPRATRSAQSGLTLGILIRRQGDLQAAVMRYRRAIAVAESASEAERELLDDLVDELRSNLALIEERLSNPLPSAKEDEDFLAKMLAGTRAAQCKDWRAKRSDCFDAFSTLFCKGRIWPPTPADLTFIRGILESDVEQVSDRVSCGISLGLLMWAMGDRKAAINYHRFALSIIASVTGADGFATHLPVEDVSRAGKHLTRRAQSLRKALADKGGPVCLVSLGRLAPGDAAYQRRFREAIVERAEHVRGSACDACGATAGHLKYCARCTRAAYYSRESQQGTWSYHRASCRPPRSFAVGDLVRVVGCEAGRSTGAIVEIRGPAAAADDRWHVAFISARTPWM
ncbi:hypothetical protein BDK51DRAFT_43827 [Blyttiomyces helicus]|uniref:MYND-type domain-containing protein n=1 Tax=Blyttiomyces helicus TaxID=388810 RepID=A0A4P9WAX7_9FUNG|nr:hypothetical protein BDK51DRAFT_43827 [Blyttiomyces helicus]|eukprot:RKO89759.1 hypothetical protein BDK51DRAFT_43827 [Blyttiomyces helicus]